MKNPIGNPSVLMISLGLLLTPAFQAGSQTVAIPDSGLQSAIRRALGNLTREITVQDMENLQRLDASSDIWIWRL